MNIFRKSLALMGAVALLLGLGVSAGQAAATDAKDEKVFTFTLSIEPDFLDPLVSYNAVTGYVVGHLYTPLFTYNSQGELVNTAVTSYDVSPDGLTYTLRLRKDNKWSDGKPVTAHDYVFGIKRCIGYGPDSTYAYFMADNIKNAPAHAVAMSDVDKMDDVGVKALDDYTMEIVLNKPIPYFTNLLAQRVALPVRKDFAKEHSSTWANDPAVPTNGPFKLSFINEKEEVVMVKNPHYFDADKVTLDKIVGKVIPDSQARLSAFETGEVDFALTIPSDAVKKYLNSPVFQNYAPAISNYFVFINSGVEPNPALTKVNVRRALALAIDRSYILDVLDSGPTRYPLYGFVPNGIPGIKGDFREEQDAVLKYNETNIAKAKELLAAEGYNEKNPLTLVYRDSSTAENTDVAQCLQALWGNVGVQVKINATENKSFVADRRAGKYNMARGAMSVDYVDPSNFLDRFRKSNQAATVVADDKFDKLMADSSVEMDHDKRMKMLHDAETYLIEDQAYVIPLYGKTEPGLLKEGITGVTFGPGGFDFTSVVMP